jgi:hypothetical protein
MRGWKSIFIPILARQESTNELDVLYWLCHAKSSTTLKYRFNSLLSIGGCFTSCTMLHQDWTIFHTKNLSSQRRIVRISNLNSSSQLILPTLALLSALSTSTKDVALVSKMAMDLNQEVQDLSQRDEGRSSNYHLQAFYDCGDLMAALYSLHDSPEYS